MNLSCSGVTKGFFDALEVGGVLAQFGWMATELGSEPPEADEDESFGAVTFTRYLGWGKTFGAIKEKDGVHRCFPNPALRIECLRQSKRLPGDVLADGVFWFGAEAGEDFAGRGARLQSTVRGEGRSEARAWRRLAPFLQGTSRPRSFHAAFLNWP